MSNQALLEKLDRTTETLSYTLAQIVKLSSISHDDDTVDSTSTLSTMGVTMVNAHTMQLVRGIQDLLVITRSIREKWVLGQVPEDTADDKKELDYQKCESLLDKCIEEIVGNVSVDI